MLRLVLDTDVVVAAVRSPGGASRQLLLDILDGRARLLLSTSLLVEYESVLTRREHLVRGRAKAADIVELLDGLANLCEPVAFDFRWRPSGASSDDELVVETAINGQADAVATFNLRDMQTALSAYGIGAHRPGPLVRRIRG
jgi:putative PIN family toxin of toxin-antitoxin system